MSETNPHYGPAVPHPGASDGGKPATAAASPPPDLADDLGHALPRRELEILYLPMVDLARDGQVYALEALLRWRHPVLGLLSPADFLPTAQTIGLTGAIDEWMLAEACRQGKEWRDTISPELRIAARLPLRQFSGGDLADAVARLLADADFPARNLELGFAEPLLMQNIEQSVAALRQLKRLGVLISMDEFGTGYSNLSYLRRFPLDQIRIDHSFLANLSRQPDEATICASIIAMAHALRLKVMAEGVEDEAQLGFLVQHRCEAMHGPLFSAPLSAGEATELLRQGRHLALANRSAAPARRLLFLDDEENVLSALKRLFRRDGYEIHTATDAVRAFEILAEHQIGVVVSDQRMPGMSGTEFLRRVKGIYPDTMRIVLSGYTELQTATDAINEGAVYRFLTKPWDDNQLRTAIRDAFLQLELARENARLDHEARQAHAELARTNAVLQDLLAEKSRHMARNVAVLGVAQEAVHYVPVPVIGMDIEGMLVLVNAAAQALIPGAVPGANVLDLPPEVAACLQEAGECEGGHIALGSRTWQCVRRRMGLQSGSAGSIMMLVPDDLAQWHASCASMSGDAFATPTSTGN